MKKHSLLIFLLIFSFQLKGQRDEINWDTIDFESPVYYLSIDSSSGNVWQVCMPNKTFFDSAFSPDSAIVTNCSDYYPDTNYSYFELYISNANHGWYPYSTFFEIKHKYDTDPGLDGGYITVSYDLGKTWMNIIHDTVYFGDIYPAFGDPHLYTEEDTLFNGEFGFSGNSKDWVTTEFSWYVWPVVNSKSVGDTMIVRFNFISDSISSDHEGWMIDDIRLFAVDLGDAINELNISEPIEIYPNPVFSEITIELDRVYSTIDAELININGKTIERFHISDSDYFTIDCSALKNGLYILKTTLNSKITKYKKIIVQRY